MNIRDFVVYLVTNISLVYGHFFEIIKHEIIIQFCVCTGLYSIPHNYLYWTCEFDLFWI